MIQSQTDMMTKKLSFVAWILWRAQSKRLPAHRICRGEHGCPRSLCGSE